MEALKAQIAAQKRKAPTAGDAAAKYIRRGDAERRQQQTPHVAPRDRGEHAIAPDTPPAVCVRCLCGDSWQEPTKPRDSGSSVAMTPAAEPAERRGVFHVSNDEAIHRLRQKGEPIRLFGESDKDRRLRLRALELLEGHGSEQHQGRNDFMRALQGAESELAREQIEKRSTPQDNSDSQHAPASTAHASKSGARMREGVGMDSVLDLDLVRADPVRAYPIIYYTLKGLLKDWEIVLAKRSDDERHSAQGRLVSATHVQTTEYLKPLFKALRRRELAPDVLMRMSEIVHYVQRREYRHANDAYLQLSIGNAPWPIGVTMFGIHERSGQEKIFTSNVAHVLNDEVSRKYIQSLKRLMTFAQTHYPPDDLSKMMG
ncbi:hypothetical protein MSPP1_002127 [Malassezia sp. CBS 17886]|nr:hypothetical protein MSPP1_002127 [Malassezia sp. CBS 17886]